MKVIIFWFSLVTLVWTMPLNAQDDCSSQKQAIATVITIEGKAKVLSKESITKHRAVKGERLFEGDKIMTGTAAMVIIKLKDDSKLILDEASELLFLGADRLRQETGEVYYKIKKRVESKGLKVETSFSIIGVKGTEFIVNLREKGEVALNEGLIGIESLQAEFELHKKKVMQEYEKYKQEQMDGFEAYKSQLEDETISYVKAFDLEAGRVLKFSDAKQCEESCSSHVSEKELSSELKERFEAYKAMLSE